jgi:organic radical activating enzyme
MKYVEPNEGLKVFDIKFEVQTAGPSPNNNKRIELFLLGCSKAMCGKACPGCFNYKLWDANLAERACDIESLAQWIIERTPESERYITLGGGEPSDDIEHLIPFCKILKEAGFHIMLYTYHDLEAEIELESTNIYNHITKSTWEQLFKYIDIVVDGPFVMNEKLYVEDYDDGFLSSIGSGNQKIYDIQYYNKHNELRGYAMRRLSAIKLGFNNELIYYLKN